VHLKNLRLLKKGRGCYLCASIAAAVLSIQTKCSAFCS
jgi:predicted RNA-binding protein YlxR (DUF448 family)